LEFVFLLVFSAIIFAVFYSLLSISGAVIGNDGSVHLGRAQEFLSTGQLSLDNLGWTPPLYQILLAFLISLTGATNIEQFLLLVKISAIAVNWLLFFSMYLVGKRFFNQKIGMVAACLLLLCFPMFEMNMWGGYTTVLGIAFMLLLFLYLPLSVEGNRYLGVVGVFAFALVLSHQLTLFVTALILMPVMLFLIIKTRGKGIKALFFILVGGGFSFFLYYIWAMLPYLDGLIGHIFFEQKAMTYQIPLTSLSAFWSSFGFILLIGIDGLFVALYTLGLKKNYIPCLILISSFLIPLVLAKSYLFGLYLPFQWFIYYVMPPLVIFAAVFLFFIADKALTYYKAHKLRAKRVYTRFILGGAMVFVVVLSCFTFVMRIDTLNACILEVVPLYATSDSQSLQVGKWLKTYYPEQVSVVVTEAPGFWFNAFCDKNVIVEIDPAVERNVISESVLALSYELESPLTLFRAYETKNDIVGEHYVSINHVWWLAALSSIEKDYISYNTNKNEHKEIPLTQMNRQYTLNNSNQTEHTLTITYTNNDLIVSQTQTITTSSYSTQILWNITPINNLVNNVTLHTSTHFNSHFNFKKAYIPNILNWENPWTNPTTIQTIDGATTNFSKTDLLTDNYIAIQDEQNQIYYTTKFHDLPNNGNINSTFGNKQIDSIHLTYTFDQITPNNPTIFSYQTLLFSKESYPQTIHPHQINKIFTTQPNKNFTVDSRNYQTLIKEHNIGFIIYDKNKLNPNFIKWNLSDLIYSNNRYTIFKINN